MGRCRHAPERTAGPRSSWTRRKEKAPAVAEAQCKVSKVWSEEGADQEPDPNEAREDGKE
jgi:hypothetical protein